MKMNKSIRFTAALAVVIITMIVTMTAPVLAQTPFTREKRATAQSADRYGNLPLGAVIRTDERYNQPGLFQGPHGWDYWNRLENPKDYQNPNLWPDKRPTYFVGQMVMPALSEGTDNELETTIPCLGAPLPGRGVAWVGTKHAIGWGGSEKARDRGVPIAAAYSGGVRTSHV